MIDADAENITDGLFRICFTAANGHWHECNSVESSTIYSNQRTSTSGDIPALLLAEMGLATHKIQ